MPLGEKLYLVLVLAAFASFAVTLAYQAHADARRRSGKVECPSLFFVMPAEAGIQGERQVLAALDSRFRGNDGRALKRASGTIHQGVAVVMPGLDAHLDLVRLVQAHDQIYAGHHQQGRGNEPHQAPPLAGAIFLITIIVGHGAKIGTRDAPVKPRQS